MISSRCFIIAGIISLSLHTQAQSQEMIYTLLGNGSGTLGTNAFNNASFTITSVADISQITNPSPGLYNVTNRSAILSVAGIGTATFTIPTKNVANHNIQGVGLGALNQNMAIFFARDNAALANYDLSSNLGPLAGTPLINAGTGFATTAGDFSLASASTATIQATVIPLLSLTLSGTNLTLSWTTNAPGFQLQASPDPGMSIWSSVTNLVLTTNGENQVTVSPANHHTFYRLDRQL